MTATWVGIGRHFCESIHGFVVFGLSAFLFGCFKWKNSQFSSSTEFDLEACMVDWVKELISSYGLAGIWSNIYENFGGMCCETLHLQVKIQSPLRYEHLEIPESQLGHLAGMHWGSKCELQQFQWFELQLQHYKFGFMWWRLRGGWCRWSMLRSRLHDDHWKLQHTWAGGLLWR